MTCRTLVEAPALPRGDNATPTTWLRVALPQALLQTLIESGLVCAADLRCLDDATKRALQRLCLERCARCMRYDEATGAAGERRAHHRNRAATNRYR